jgi:hypothetical protein
MKSVCTLKWALVVGFLSLSASHGFGDDGYGGRSLIRPSVDQLIPTSYPIIHPRFDRLRSTVYPLIRPGVPQVGITNNLVNSRAQPLLITYGASYGSSLPLAAKKVERAVLRAPTNRY